VQVLSFTQMATVGGMSPISVAAGITDAPGNSVCVPCKARGHVCFAQKMVDEEAWCVFCLDDRACLWQQKELPTKPKLKKAVETEGLMAVEGAERASSSNPEKQKKSGGNGQGNGHGTNGSTHQPERICGRPECGATLAERSRSGFCQKHTHDAAGRRPAAASHRHTHDSEKPNGHLKNGSEQKLSNPKAGNGVELTLAPENLQPDRIDQLLLSLPLTERVRLAGAWLTGKI